MNIKNEVLIRVYIVLIGIVLIGIILFAQTVRISVIEGDKWRKLGEKLYVVDQPIKAERGNIMTEDGSLLATSLPFFDIRFDPNSTGMAPNDFEANVDSLAHSLALYVDNTYTVGGMRDYLIEKKAAGARDVLIKRNVTYLEKEMIAHFPLFEKGQYRGGLKVIPRPKRVRPFKQLGYRTIGYVGDKETKVGLEGSYDKILAGTQGRELVFRAPGNIYIPQDDLMGIEPQRGDDIVTTIDVNLQDITHEALLRGLKYHKADHGTAILMEVGTGAIRAISNIGKTEKGYFEIYNYGVGAATEPGSTYKLASIMALLEDGYIDLDDSIDIEKGKAMFYEEEMLDASPASFSIDTTTIRHAFEISSNVGIAKLVQKYYGDRKKGDLQYVERLKDFRLHLPTGVKINGEAAPYIKTPYSKEDDWSGITLPWMSIGYELTITPLQLLSFYNAVANEGIMMKPYLVSEVRHFDETVEKYKPTIVKQRIASRKTIQKACELLLGVVERGTAKSLKTSRYKFAGKTGTAQIDYRKFRAKANIRYQASFAGFFPAEKPVYTCIVVITDPKENGIYGGEVAGPIFREIADRCFNSRLELHKALNEYAKPTLAENKLPGGNVGLKRDMKEILTYLDMDYEELASSKWAVVRAQSDTLKLQNRLISDDVVPNVVGMGIRDALYILENRGLKVVINGSGKVRRQSIIPGTKIQGQTIRLSLR